MKVMTVHKTIETKTKKISLVGADRPTHIHINDFVTNKNSVLVRIDDIKNILEL